MARLPFISLLAYGLFGLPLALVALPIYVYVPQFYSERFGLSLTMIGTTLLVARVFDAFLDPAIGGWIDRRRTGTGFGRFILVSLPFLSIGFVALFIPLPVANGYPLTWFTSALVLVYVGFSLATIAHQSWGAALTQALSGRARVTGVREACGLVGVIMAAVLATWIGLAALSLVFVVVLIFSAVLLLKTAPVPPASLDSSAFSAAPESGLTSLAEPFRNRRFRWLFSVLIFNGIAASIPATLFLFFAKDQLQLEKYSGLFLVLYFLAAAASMPLWIGLSQRVGEARAWLISMLLAALVFVWAYGLAAGAVISFGVICILSGLALGADLALPPALLAGVIARAGHSGRREGAYFGAWNWATKMNLALAAGISLPLLEWLGYVPGVVTQSGNNALAVGYAVLPCGLKLIAAAVLWRAPLRDV